MDLERELALQERIDSLTKELTGMMMELPEGASDPGDNLMSAAIELEDLRNELQFLRDAPPDLDEDPGSVPAPLKPRSPLRSGAIALPEPEPEKEGF